MEEIKQEAFNQISTKSGPSESDETEIPEKDFSSWHIVQRHFLRMHMMTQKSRHELKLKKSQAGFQIISLQWGTKIGLPYVKIQISLRCFILGELFSAQSVRQTPSGSLPRMG